MKKSLGMGFNWIIGIEGQRPLWSNAASLNENRYFAFKEREICKLKEFF